MTDFGDMSKRISKFRGSLKDGLTDTTKEAVRRMQREVEVELRSNRSIARRHLLRSITSSHNPTRGDLLIVSSVEAPEWAKYLEHGTGIRARQDSQPNHKQYKAPTPGPPTEDILTWILAKNITPNEYDTVYGLAGAITETIGQKGQYPRPFMRPVWYNPTRGWESVVDMNHRELKKQLRRL